MSRKKISTTIYVTPEQSERLRLLHERTKVPVAVYIREGIDLVLRQYAHLLPGQLSLSEPGTPAAATSAGRIEAESKPAAIRQERSAASSTTQAEPAPERVAGGKA
jgi:Ribbon-helix-helix domain